MQDPENQKHSSHLSIRMPYVLGKDLEKEAKRQRTTVNALVNRVVERYLAFDRMAGYDRSVVLEGRCFGKIIEKMSAEDLIQIARNLGPKTVKRDFAFFGITPNLDNLVSKHLEPTGAYSDRFDFNASGENPNLRLVLTHEYGRKWSEFLAEYYDKVIESILGTRASVTIEDDHVTIEFGFGALPRAAGSRNHHCNQ